MNNLQHGYVLLQDAANTFKISVPRVACWTLRQVKLFKISMRSLGGELQKREGRKMEKSNLKLRKKTTYELNVRQLKIFWFETEMFTSVKPGALSTSIMSKNVFGTWRGVQVSLISYAALLRPLFFSWILFIPVWLCYRFLAL